MTATVIHAHEQTTSRVTIRNGSGAVAACSRCGGDTDRRVVLVNTAGTCRVSRPLCPACRTLATAPTPTDHGLTALIAASPALFLVF